MLSPNTILQNRYLVVRKLGEGGMGAVYEAIDRRVSCVVALKETLSTRDGEARSAFEREVQILSRPAPIYTEEARKNLVSGTVVLTAVLAANGQVTNIRVSKGLPNGLTEQAIAAALKVKFNPAMKDGHPVSQSIQFEYNFSPY